VKTFDVSLFFTLSKEKASPFKNTMSQSIFQNSIKTIYQEKKNQKHFFSMIWRRQSPDLNPIEFLWYKLDLKKTREVDLTNLFHS
jgi:hypothetical protein